MRLSKRSEYGLRAALQLAAGYKDGYIQTRELSRREQLPNKFLESILRSMKGAGLLISKVGAAGGYRLADRPENISVGRIVRVLEGQLINPELLEPPADPSNARRGGVGLHLLAVQTEKALTDLIDSLTLADLLEQAGRFQGDARSMYYI
jgi:Rrf2 family protein